MTDISVPTRCAGVVLASPFIAQLFDRLGVRIADGALHEADLPLAVSALLCLCGDVGAPDPLHHILLGLAAEVPLAPCPLDTAQFDLIEGLLLSITRRWSQLRNTSRTGLQETFLRRPGIMEYRDDGPLLVVERGPYDMLLDELPWPINPVNLPWMQTPCVVEWRQG